MHFVCSGAIALTCYAQVTSFAQLPTPIAALQRAVPCPSSVWWRFRSSKVFSKHDKNFGFRISKCNSKVSLDLQTQCSGFSMCWDLSFQRKETLITSAESCFRALFQNFLYHCLLSLFKSVFNRLLRTRHVGLVERRGCQEKRNEFV